MSKSRGDMYSWVDETWNPFAGECHHWCRYCFVKSMNAPPVAGKYSGPPRLVEKELRRRGRRKTIFVSSCNDLFAENVPETCINRGLRSPAWVLSLIGPRLVCQGWR